MDVMCQPEKEKIPMEEVIKEGTSLTPDKDDCNGKCDSNRSIINPEDQTHKFTHSEVFRLRHHLVMNLEELKLRKECEDRHDMKIKELLSQVYELEKSKDSLQLQLKQEEAKLNCAMTQMKQVREEQQASTMAKPTVTEPSSDDDQSIDILKEEARKLQLVNFQQERTIKNLEAKIQSQASSAKQVMTQISSLEEKHFIIKDLYQETVAYLGRLEITELSRLPNQDEEMKRKTEKYVHALWSLIRIGEIQL